MLKFHQSRKLKDTVGFLLAVSLMTVLFVVINKENLLPVSNIAPWRIGPDPNTTDAVKNTTVNDTDTGSMSASISQQPNRTSNFDKHQMNSKPTIQSPGKTLWKEHPILTPAIAGRLGNQMFEYASTYGLATFKNMSVFISKSHLLNRLFSLDMERVTHQDCERWHKVTAPCCDYDPSLEHRIDRHKCQVVGDFLQSWKYFKNVSASIHSQFTFKPVTAKSAHEKLLFVKKIYKHVNSSRLRNSSRDPSFNWTYQEKDTNVTFIGIHARRGDFLTQSSLNLGRITPPLGYYIRAMDYFRGKYSNPLFVAASDSPLWLRKNLKRPDVAILSGNAPEVDMCILSMCNHTIISVGSFGWWVGFLNKGTTIYYGEHPPPKTAMAGYFKHFEEDYIYPGWIGMK